MKVTELFEAVQQKTAIISWGRMNPPTIGHQRVIDVVKSTAQKASGDPIIFVTKTQDPKKNPLSFAEKVHFIQELFPGVTVNQNTSVKTIIQALQLLQGMGYHNVGIVAGSDRVQQYQELVDKYNNTPDKSGNVPFSFKNVKVFSSGERDPDADDVTGMSASKMRQFAIDNDFSSFKQGVTGDNEILAKQMFNRVRQGMGLDNSTNEERTRDDAKKEDVDESLVIDATSLRSHIIGLIADKIANTDDVNKLADWLRYIVGKDVKPRGSHRYEITAEDVACAIETSLSEEAAGVGTLTDYNTTKDVKKGTLRKMLKAFRLV